MSKHFKFYNSVSKKVKLVGVYYNHEIIKLKVTLILKKKNGFDTCMRAVVFFCFGITMSVYLKATLYNAMRYLQVYKLFH